MLRFMDQEVFWLHMSQRLLCLLAMNQFGAPGTSRVKPSAKLGYALRVHVQNALHRLMEQTEGTQRARIRA